MHDSKESLEIKSWSTKNLFVCQYGKSRRLTSCEQVYEGFFWFRELDYERPSDVSGVHLIASQ